MTDRGVLRESISVGTVQRLRPTLMTVGTAFMGLVPILWSTGQSGNIHL